VPPVSRVCCAPDAFSATHSDLDTPEGCKTCVLQLAQASDNCRGTGQEWKAGQKLLVLEAMKRNRGGSSSAGTVEKLHCAPGSLVSSDRYYWRFARRQQHEDFGKVKAVYDRLEAAPSESGVDFTGSARERAGSARGAELEDSPQRPLTGMTFAVKEQRRCCRHSERPQLSAYAYTPASKRDCGPATRDAGAILIARRIWINSLPDWSGRAPRSAPAPAVFDERYISAARVRVQQLQ